MEFCKICIYHRTQKDYNDDIVVEYCASKDNKNNEEGNITSKDCPSKIAKEYEEYHVRKNNA